MGVTAQISEHFGRAGKGGLAVDDPGLVPQLRKQGVETLGPGQRRYARDACGQGELAVVIEVSQAVEEFAAKDLAQSLDREEVTRMGLDPALAIERQTAAGDETVDVEMGAELLISGMQHHGNARQSIEVVTAKLQESFRGGLEEQLQKRTLVLLLTEDEWVEFVRQGEDIVEIGYGQEFGLTFFEPLGCRQGLTLGAVAVAAGVVGVAFEAAGGAVVAMSAQNGGAAGFDGPQHLQLLPGQTLMGTELGAVQAHDVRQLAPRPGHGCGMTTREQHRRWLALRLLDGGHFLGLRHPQQIKRAL